MRDAASARRPGRWRAALWVGAALVCRPEMARADNPIIQTKFTADPAPLVYDGTVYLYTSHDEDSATGFTMFDWLLYSSTDMVNWTDHGVIAGVKEPNKTFKWADGVNAWAPQTIARNGKFYLYVPFPKGGHMIIGVAVADQPTGPFVDVIGAPLVNNPSTSTDIDPTVFIDNDGQGYLYWGHQPDLSYVKLNQDMVSYSGSIVHVTRPQTFEEGPWFFRRNDNYYLAFASTCCPEGIGYAMSSSATGPWTFKGSIMDGTQLSSGNHPGIIDYQGSSYLFGFNYFLNNNLTKDHHERRSINVTKFTYGADGSIPKQPWWTSPGVAQIGHLNPYTRTQAETIAFESGAGGVPCTSSTDYNCWKAGVKTEASSDSGGGMDVTNIQNGSFIKVQGVDFAAGAASLDVRVASASVGGKIEARLDSATGTLIGTCAVPSTGGAQSWMTASCAISGASGIHDLFFVFVGGTGNLFNFNWWQFQGSNVDPGTPTMNVGGAGSQGGTSGASGGGGRQNGGDSGTTSGAGSAGFAAAGTSGGGGPSGGGQTTGGQTTGGQATGARAGPRAQARAGPRAQAPAPHRVAPARSATQQGPTASYLGSSRVSSPRVRIAADGRQNRDRDAGPSCVEGPAHVGC